MQPWKAIHKNDRLECADKFELKNILIFIGLKLNLFFYHYKSYNNGCGVDCNWSFL